MRNKFPGFCYQCGKWVKAGEGHFQKLFPPNFDTWKVHHAECAIKFRNERRAITPDLKKDGFMFSKIAMRGFLIALSSAFSELAGSMDSEAAEAGTKEIKTKEKTAKEKAAGGKTTKKAKVEPVVEEEEMEEVESKYSDSAEDTEPSEDEDDDFAGMEEAEEEKEKTQTTEDLRDALVAYAKENGKPKAYEILAKFKGATKANQVKGADIAKAIKLLAVKKK